MKARILEMIKNMFVTRWRLHLDSYKESYFYHEMIKVIRIIFLSLSLVLVMVLIWASFNHSLVNYGWHQLKGQMQIINNSRPLEDVLSDPTFPDSLKEKIRFIDVIARFAHDSLGLERSKNYSTLYDQKNKPILWTITACDKYEFKPYLWHFPILGNVSYKGFFDFQEGFAEDSILKLKRYDTEYGEVTAWSTLGWFKDPILSSMLKRSAGQLAELIIHEMTHSTIYLKSNVDLNENIASMIGEEGAIRFLKSHFGLNSKELNDYISRKADYDLFSQYMLTSHNQLDSLYKRISSLPISDKEIQKQKVIQQIVTGLDSIPFHNPKRYRSLFSELTPNNAYFMNFVRYDSQKEKMKKELDQKFKGNIVVYLHAIKERKK